jgi:hypothetical protein
MCGEQLPSDINSLNTHIDRCLAAQSAEKPESYSIQSSTTNSPAGILLQSAVGRGQNGKKNASFVDDDEELETKRHDFQEYTWAGQTRIRATALIEGGFEGTSMSIEIRTKFLFPFPILMFPAYL